MKALAAVALGLLALAGCRHTADPTQADARAEIHALLVEYGRTLDARDFAGFSALFARGGVYVAGGGAEIPGAEAGAAMERIFAENALGFREPNYHLFFNEVIAITGPDTARATSQSLYMVPAEDGAPQPAMMAAYEDQLVREDGRWKFARRVVRALMPAPSR